MSKICNINPQEWGFPVDVCKYSTGACLSTSWTCCSLPAQPVRPGARFNKEVQPTLS